jgi:hypothetical protein
LANYATLLLTSDEFFLAFHPSLVFRMETPIVATALDGSGSAGFRFHVACFSRRKDEACVTRVLTHTLFLSQQARTGGTGLLHDKAHTACGSPARPAGTSIFLCHPLDQQNV